MYVEVFFRHYKHSKMACYEKYFICARILHTCKIHLHCKRRIIFNLNIFSMENSDFDKLVEVVAEAIKSIYTIFNK